MHTDYANYHVALKALLRRGDEVLILFTPSGDKIDLPGGRINKNEDQIPLSEILDREIKEELGNDLKYSLNKPLLQFRIIIKDSDRKTFLTVYDAEYISGEIKLSEEHSRYEWINPKTVELREEMFISAEEYEAFKKYFNQE